MILPAQAIRQAIKRGTILHSTMFEDIGHGKFFVVVGVTKLCVVGFFFVNSNIHPSIMKKQAQLDMQYPLRKADYSFLHHDSFVCATRIIQRASATIAESIENGQTTIVDQLREEHVAELLEMVRQSKLFSKKEKEEFFS